MPPDPTTGKINHLWRATLLAFTAVALSLVFWTVFRAPSILARDDNPRRVESELRIWRGRILDQAGNLLAESIRTDGAFARRYPLPAASPVVGYYSLRYGTAGIEQSYDPLLRGETEDPWLAQRQELLHLTQTGRDVRLTLNAELQAQADALLGSRKGALLLLRLGENVASDPVQIVALASHPGYDPNVLEEAFETLSADQSAPLLNRVTQGQYQPGLLLQPFILAAALEQDAIRLDEAVAHVNRPVIVNEVATYCATSPPDSATWGDVLANRCPGPMNDLAQELSAADLTAAFNAFRLMDQPRLPLNTETAVSTPISNTTLALIGQDTLVVTPLQVGVAWAALAADGRLPTLQLVEAVEGENGAWLEEALPEQLAATAVRPMVARQVLQALPTAGGHRAFSTLVLSGPDGSTNGWFLGLTPAENPAYAVVVVVENSRQLRDAEEIGQAMLTAVTAP